MRESPTNTVSDEGELKAVVSEIRRRLINVERKINFLLGDNVPLAGLQAVNIVGALSDQKYGSQTYAQHGDDLAILNIFDMIGITKPTYLDIGAHDPFKISNTALLYLRGSRGINVEANPVLIKAFHTQRPEDTNLNMGVTSLPGVMKFYIFDDRSGLNTFSADQARHIEDNTPHKVQKTIDVLTTTIPEIIQKYAAGIFPDLLSVDVEGLDLEILKTIEFETSFPKLICVEANSIQIGRDITNFLEMNHYDLYFKASANLFFLRSDLKRYLRP